MAFGRRKSLPVRAALCIPRRERQLSKVGKVSEERYMKKEESKERVLPPATEPSDWTAWEGFMQTKAQMPQGH